ncbi:MAG: hypothetical protein ACERKD_08555 [Prolixibacteraceae bacterium]
MFYTILKHTHSGTRWLLLLFLLVALVSALVKLSGKKEYTKSDKMSAMLAMSFTHLQLLIGLILYFISGKVVFSGESMQSDLLRFFLVEHIGMMLVAIVLITIGYSKIKKASDSSSKQKRTLIYYGIALIIMLAAIPWPWQQLGAAWF